MVSATALIVDVVRAVAPGGAAASGDHGGPEGTWEAALGPQGAARARAFAAEVARTVPAPSVLRAGPEPVVAATLGPVADALGLEVVCDPDLAAPGDSVVGDDEAWLASVLVAGRAVRALERTIIDARGRSTQDGAAAVICADGGVTAALVALVAGRDGVRMPDVGGRPLSRVRLWVDADSGRVSDAAHVPPPA